MPSDWGNYYNRCNYCGGRYHGSEGGCGCLDDHEKCAACESGPRSFSYHDNQAEAEGWHHVDDLTMVGDRYFCANHLTCACCESTDSVEALTWSEDASGLVCPKCVTDDHWCEAQGPLLDHVARQIDQPAG